MMVSLYAVFRVWAKLSILTKSFCTGPHGTAVKLIVHVNVTVEISA